MIDYIVIYQENEEDGVKAIADTILTVEEGYIEDGELLEDILLEKLKEELDINNVEIISYESLIDNEIDVENIE